MKTVVKGILSSFAKTRAWQVNQLARAQKVIQMAIRLGAIRRAGLKSRVITYLAQWESFDTMVRRATLMWIGHVRAYACKSTPEKLAIWLVGRRHLNRLNGLTLAFRRQVYPRNRLVPFSSRSEQRVYQAFPTEAVIPDHERALDRWKVGCLLPPHIPMDAFRRVSNSPEAGGSDVDLGEVRRGRNRNRTRKLYGETDRDKFAVNVRQQRAHKTEQGTWKCLVCDEESHAVSDPSQVTAQSFPCDQCGQNFRRRTQQRNHLSPVNRPLYRSFSKY